MQQQLFNHFQEVSMSILKIIILSFCCRLHFIILLNYPRDTFLKYWLLEGFGIFDNTYTESLFCFLNNDFVVTLHLLIFIWLAISFDKLCLWLLSSLFQYNFIQLLRINSVYTLAICDVVILIMAILRYFIIFIQLF